jgi:hypothetical protein
MIKKGLEEDSGLFDFRMCKLQHEEMKIALVFYLKIFSLCQDELHASSRPLCRKYSGRGFVVGSAICY